MADRDIFYANGTVTGQNIRASCAEGQCEAEACSVVQCLADGLSQASVARLVTRTLDLDNADGVAGGWIGLQTGGGEITTAGYEGGMGAMKAIGGSGMLLSMIANGVKVAALSCRDELNSCQGLASVSLVVLSLIGLLLLIIPLILAAVFGVVIAGVAAVVVKTLSFVNGLIAVFMRRFFTRVCNYFQSGRDEAENAAITSAAIIDDVRQAADGGELIVAIEEFDKGVSMRSGKTFSNEATQADRGNPLIPPLGNTAEKVKQAIRAGIEKIKPGEEIGGWLGRQLTGLGSFLAHTLRMTTVDAAGAAYLCGSVRLVVQDATLPVDGVDFDQPGTELVIGPEDIVKYDRAFDETPDDGPKQGSMYDGRTGEFITHNGRYIH